MKWITCWIEHATNTIDQTYDYVCPFDDVKQGMRVLIPFGNQKVIGFVDQVNPLQQYSGEFELKQVMEVIDENPILNEELWQLGQWMQEQYVVPRIACYKTMLPSQKKPTSKYKKAVKETWVKIVEGNFTLTKKQQEAYTWLSQNQPVLYAELRKRYSAVVSKLVEKQAIFKYAQERKAKLEKDDVLEEPYALNAQQQLAYQQIMEGDLTPYLLFGVTGSGKTEVYMQLAQQVIQQGQQVLFLVPEIGLTPQMIARLKKRFGHRLAVYHSQLSDQEKYEQFQLVCENRVDLVVGTRSSVFLPFKKLGLIIMDEEHDGSYKQDHNPCYHCRQIVLQRAKYHQCKVIMGSATPSVDSFARALKGVYHLIQITQRVNQTFPEIEVVEMASRVRHLEDYIISKPLQHALKETFNQGKQAIILHNKRGYHTYLKCYDCQQIYLCPSCDVALHYHKEENVLKCHSCGYTTSTHTPCANCGSQNGYASFGFGTQRVVEALQKYFPERQILRMDRDTTRRKNSFDDILTKFGQHQADILVGTQMVAKGFDFPDVTLVGIVSGDDGLLRTDFQSTSTTFELLMQATGRSGRASSKGKAIIQVNQPDHYVIEAVKRQDYLYYFQKEMAFRHAGNYPPYTYMIALKYESKQEVLAMNVAMDMMAKIVGSFKTLGIISYGKRQDKYGYGIILKGKDPQAMLAKIHAYKKMCEYDLNGLRVDVDPLHLE